MEGAGAGNVMKGTDKEGGEGEREGRWVNVYKTAGSEEKDEGKDRGKGSNFHTHPLLKGRGVDV